MITTGGSALQACEAVKEEQGTILMVLAAVDRQEGGRETIEEAGYRVEVLFGVDEFRQLLQDAGDQ